MSVKFHFQKRITLVNTIGLKKFLKQIADTEGTVFDSMNFIFCDDLYMININKTYLKHDYFTDIITFNLSRSGRGNANAEFYIGVETVATNANKYEVDFYYELNRVLFHGILHLCGYNDKSRKEKKIMREREDYYLNIFYS